MECHGDKAGTVSAIAVPIKVRRRSGRPRGGRVRPAGGTATAATRSRR